MQIKWYTILIRLSQSRSLGFLVWFRSLALRAQKLDLWASLDINQSKSAEWHVLSSTYD